MLTLEQKQDLQERRAALLDPILESFGLENGIDGQAILESFRKGKFSYAAVERDLRAHNRAGNTRLAEAITTSQMANTISLTMINEIVDDYTAYVPTYKGLAEEHTSNSLDELYPEEWEDSMPVSVGETEEAPESRIAGGQVRIRNYEFARTLVISKKLFDRDKMGQAKSAARKFGKNFEQIKDKTWIFAFFRAGTVANIGRGTGQVPVSNLAGQTTGMTTSPGPITPQRLEDALTAPAFFVDPYNNIITVEMDTVLVDSFDRFKTMRFLDSLYNPVGVPAAADNTNITAGPFTNNILKGMLNVKWSPFVKQSRVPLAGAGNGLPWATLQAGRGPVMQTVHDLEVDQEAANSGKSFDERSYRWQATVEFGAGVKNPRLIFWGN